MVGFDDPWTREMLHGLFFLSAARSHLVIFAEMEVWFVGLPRTMLIFHLVHDGIDTMEYPVVVDHSFNS